MAADHATPRLPKASAAGTDIPEVELGWTRRDPGNRSFYPPLGQSIQPNGFVQEHHGNLVLHWIKDLPVFPKEAFLYSIFHATPALVLQPAPLNGLIQLIQKLRTSYLQRLFGLWANQDVEELWIQHPGPGGGRDIVRMYPHTPGLAYVAGRNNVLR